MQRISLLLLPGLICAGAAQAQVTAEQALAQAEMRFSGGSCGKPAAKDEILVCGGERSKYRLPLRVKTSTVGQRMAGDIPLASGDVALSRECGVHFGQRRCSLREMRAHGYGGGSTPIRALVMLGRALVNPDAEIGPVGGKPITREERE